ncbi:MAG: DNA-processing protein DprA [Proteobacteria bacterium]|nr:DNA-processing protein DprA [Pseudomonadota bacterium]
MTKNTQDKIDWLRLARSENVGPITFFRLIKAYGSATKALKHVSELRGKISLCSEEKVRKELEEIESFGAEILLFSDENYPQLLREIPSPPPVLTIKGEKSFLQRNSVAIVGARNASLNSANFARSISVEVGNHSIIIVSGMARGIDTAAHEAALKNGTIGVIAGGINNIYPKENERLYGRVIDSGLIVSEAPFNAPPKSENFIQRNRLISGLSLATIVVEAGLKSGSLSTARFATEQGREVFSVPGSPFDLRCKGTNRLIKEGATIFENIEDFLDSFPHLRKSQTQLFETKTEIKKDNIVDDEIRKIREEILQKLSHTPVEIDEIIQDLQVSSNLVNIALIELEIENKIEINFGKVAISSF